MAEFSMSSGQVKVGEVRLLLAFDFDHTLINENSDLCVTNLSPGGKLPCEIKQLHREDGWTKYMGEIFKFLHRNGQTPDNILRCMSEIPLTDGIKELIDFTTGSKLVDHIIISDANSVFIEQVLKEKQLLSSIMKTFTNPAHFEADGCLSLKEYHRQDWCTLSTENLCKGHILKSFLAERLQQGVTYLHVIYVGDGYNDLCPGLTLRPQDYLMPRVGFKLHSLVESIVSENKPVPKEDLKAAVVPWKSGLDILKHLKDLSFIKTRCAS